MKWGVRKDEKSSSTKKPRPLSKSEKQLARSYRKQYKNLSKAEAEEAARRSSRNKKLIITGAAVVTGAALGYVAYKTYNRMAADNIIKAGHTMQTVHNHPEIIANGEKFYTAANKADKWKYLAAFSKNHRAGDIAQFGQYKKRVTMTASDNIKVAGLKTGRKVYEDLKATNPQFAALEKGKGYRDFNTYRLLGKTNTAANIYIDKLKSMGYDGVADINDRTGWKTNAHILFGNNKITDIKISDIATKEVAKAQVGRTIVETLQANSDPYSLIVGGSVAGGLALEYNDYRTEKKLKSINDSRKRKKK